MPAVKKVKSRTKSVIRTKKPNPRIRGNPRISIDKLEKVNAVKELETLNTLIRKQFIEAEWAYKFATTNFNLPDGTPRNCNDDVVRRHYATSWYNSIRLILGLPLVKLSQFGTK